LNLELMCSTLNYLFGVVYKAQLDNSKVLLMSGPTPKSWRIN
jgi:hypothetical protein